MLPGSRQDGLVIRLPFYLFYCNEIQTNKLPHTYANLKLTISWMVNKTIHIMHLKKQTKQEYTIRVAKQKQVFIHIAQSGHQPPLIHCISR
jgi:hypothetical protein